MKYYIWTSGCQMNVADSRQVSSALEQLNYQETDRAENADVVVLNTCVIRQSAEDSATGRISSLQGLKRKNPNMVINVMGCLVGVKGHQHLAERFPHVDVFSPPSDPGPLIAYLTQDESRALEEETTARRFAFMDEELPLPKNHSDQVTAYVHIVLGCSHACTYCIVPYRRGPERSRPVENIAMEVKSLVKQGVKEITLLGQIVDRYGVDLPQKPTLSSLLREVHDTPGLERLRFLTSHPNWMTNELLDTVAELPKVMPHIEVPIQSGDDEVLANMKRGYTTDEYRELIHRIRTRIPNVGIANDIIVGFPGETEEQFQHTYNILEELKLDVAHLARYSGRQGTVATRRMKDNVPEEEKWRRFRVLEELQKGIAAEINSRYEGKTVKVLFENKVRGRWRGRTPNNKLVFTETEQNLHGKVIPVTITWTGPWSMQGKVETRSKK
ncbi:MAG: tRNA (N6-isopentenyl adenosine(37)-C2)-methylthiotransferase MiaB [Anaerolineaceae bacterium 4572_5.1]|nr:MAG: tRNA (N6-isopentenyl adenosine(37)-C2)-methylthiotransferase MiaB [Anaerolineaceae bacterium 4572_5.1]